MEPAHARINRYWFRLGLTAVVSVFAFVYVLNNDGWGELAQVLTSEGGEGFAQLLKVLGAVLPSLAVVLPPLLGAYRALRPFGLSPKTLLGTVSTTPDGAVTAQPGVRYRFAEEFKEVTQALKPHHLVIFIDDLDRCEKEHVLEVLETINFLVSAGECYIVIGMSRRWAETCVGLAFKELAEEAPDNARDASARGAQAPAPAKGTDADAQAKAAARSERLRFARQYLEKLINIEVPIPLVTDTTSAALLDPERKKPATWDRIVKVAAAPLRAASFLIFMRPSSALRPGSACKRQTSYRARNCLPRRRQRVPHRHRPRRSPAQPKEARQGRSRSARRRQSPCRHSRSARPIGAAVCSLSCLRPPAPWRSQH